MRKLFCLTVMVVFCLTLFIGVPVNAQEQAKFKVAPVGSFFKFKAKNIRLFSDDIYENDMTILSVDGFTIKYQYKTPTANTVRELKAFIVEISPGENITPESMDKIKGLFPLLVGKKAALQHSGSGWSNSGVAEVIKIEEVTVPAGTFKTFVIRTTMGNLPWFSSTRIYWYSSEIGWFVKTSRVVRKKNEADENRLWELISYTLKK